MSGGVLPPDADIEEADHHVLQSALVGLANELDFEDIRTTVLPDLDAFIAGGTGG